MNIDKNAPLVSRNETIINAPIEKVWKIQTDINNWPKWQKEISSAQLTGELKKGTAFRWKVMGMNITSELQEVEKNKTIGWTGNSIGMNAIHFWYFEKQGNKTKVTTEESLSGWLPKIIKIFKPNFLNESLEKSLNTLKLQAEKK